MALDARYITGVDLEQYFVDKVTGEPLANGYVKFWEDESRTTPKNVYQISGGPPNYVYEVLPNPLTLSSVGTPENANGDNVAIYYYPYDESGNLEYYYVEVFNENDVLQLTREGWPNITERDDPSFDSSTTDNQISNSQFVDVSFFPDDGIVITFDAAISAVSYDIAPDWSVVISSNGAGSLTVNRVALEGALNIATNPPYIMTFLPSGATISSLRLVQRLSHNPGIWSSTTSQTGYVAGYMLVSSLDGLNHTVQMQYSPSVAPSAKTIVSGVTGISGYKELYATVELDPSVNSEDANDGYVDIEVVLPVNGYVSVTSVQLKGLYANETISLYDQETVNRQLDHLFNYYKEPLELKPIKSYLNAWDFPLNPCQIGASSGTMGALGSNTSKYVWDRTIAFQSATNSISYSRSATGALLLTSTATTQPAIVQYLVRNQILDIFMNKLSVNVNLVSVDVQDGTVGTVSLWYSTSGLPSLGSSQSIVGSLDPYGKPSSFNGDWVEIPCGNLNATRFGLSNTTGYNQVDYAIEGFEVEDLEDAIGSGQYFAIVVGFSSILSGDTIGFQSVSLVPGEIATRPAPQSATEVLRECRYFYEKSYEDGTPVLTATYAGAVFCPLNNFSATFDGTGVLTDNANIYGRGFEVFYKEPKWVTPNFYTISPSVPGGGGGLNVEGRLSASTFPAPNSGSNPEIVALGTNYSQVQNSTSSVTYANIQSSVLMRFNSVGGNFDPAMTFSTVFHYVADCQPGLI